MEETKQYQVVDNVEKLEETIARVREAQKKFADYTQEQVDAIFFAAAMAANQQRIPLAKMAVEETGMGVVEDKVIKNHYASEYIYNAYRHTKTCGVIEEDKSFGIKKIAEPVGVVGAVIPTTNPTSTAIFKTLIALKTRNGIIISPHPRAKKSTIAAARIVLEAAVKAGAPEGIIGWIDVPSLEMTNLLMKEADVILATGGPGMVKAAYSSGKPAVGVGAGNTPAIIDDSADILLAVNSIIHSKTFDNGMICASEQSVIVLDKVYDKVKKEFKARGCYFLSPEETEKVRKTIQRQDSRSESGEDSGARRRHRPRRNQDHHRRSDQRRHLRRVRARETLPRPRHVQGEGFRGRARQGGTPHRGRRLRSHLLPLHRRHERQG